MIIDFVVENFRSFRDETRFSMLASSKKSREPAVDAANTFQVFDGVSLLKAAVIYGANASGKSNLFKSLVFMRLLVLNSSRESQADEPIKAEPFRLDAASRNGPSKFELTFVNKGTQYRYGFVIRDGSVDSEWLYHVPSEREALIFSRVAGEIKLSERFAEARGLEPRTRKNALFLSVCAQWNVGLALELLRWFRDLSILAGDSDSTQRATLRAITDDARRSKVVALLKGFDLGFEDIRLDVADIDTQIADAPEELRPVLTKIRDLGQGKQMLVRTLHKTIEGGDEFFDLEKHESAGTKKLFALAWPIADILENGRVLFIDELDARLHPLITLAILNLFRSPLSNPKNAQLVFATHDTNLLDRSILRRDQLWFVEKNSQAASSLYSLVEYKPRNDAALEPNYIAGRYGAIPFVANAETMARELQTSTTPLDVLQ